MGPYVFLAVWGVGAFAIGAVFFTNSEKVSARALERRGTVLNSPRGIKIGGLLFMVAGPVALVVAVVNFLSQ